MWYVLIERFAYDAEWSPLPPYALGPYSTEQEAQDEAQDGLATECFVTIDAKTENYCVDDVKWTDTLPADALLVIPPECEENYERTKNA